MMLLRCFVRVRFRYWQVSVIMPSGPSLFSLRVSLSILICFAGVSIAQAQGAKQAVPEASIPDSDGDHVKERSEWFFRGRLVRGKASAELRRRAYLAKLQMRVQHAAVVGAAAVRGNGQVSLSSGSWIALGPMPLASDATGNGTQDYHQVSGRATAVAIDPADATGNTVYIGGAQSGVWKSTNAANNTANSVTWTAVSDDQATLSIGAIAIQPGNTDPAKTVLLAATGEADNSGDSYFGLGILRSTNAGNSWTLISTANSGALSFSGLGGTRMVFNTASGQTNTVVSAMATSSEGMIDGAVSGNTTPGLYTSLDAGQTWTYDALVDPGGATDATSATSVVYNDGAGLFFAAVRYHGLYSSSDGTHWTRLAAQPGGALLSATACPPQSTSNNYSCPFYRAEITAVPGRNEMYAWFIYLSAGGSPVDGGIWQSANGGASWTSISDTAITNCGDFDGCGVQQGSYNLALLAGPNAAATDLYAGAVNVYRCHITTANPTCAASPFLNLTHVYGCNPIGAPAHVHPDQHALASMIGNINPNQFPISSVAIDSSDTSGKTAYVTVMGFTGGTGHVWKTTNAGTTWTDFTGSLPDSPANAVVVYPGLSQVYVATDVGVFGSSTSSASWTELGPNPTTKQFGFLPNVAVTALGVFNSGGQQLLRASTYGRGIWQFNLVITPDFQMGVSNSPATVFLGQTAALNGTASALNGYASSVTLSCAAGSTAAPGTCSPSPTTLTPANKTPFAVTVGGAAGDYNFNVQAAGSDTKHITHQVPVTLHVISFGMTTPSPASVPVGRGSTSAPVSFQVTAAGSFNQSVAVSCGLALANATCALTPGTNVNPSSTVPVNMTASVTVPAGASAGSYPVTIQATTAGAPSAVTVSFTLNVTVNPDFILTEPSAFPEVNVGSTGTSGTISIASQDGFSGTVGLSCPTTYGAGSCSISPTPVSSFPATATLTINGTSFAAGSYSLSITGTSGAVVHSLAVAFNVGDYSISGTQALSLAPGGQGMASLKLTSSTFYSGRINASCDASALSGAMCALSPANPIALASGGTANLSATVNVPSNACRRHLQHQHHDPGHYRSAQPHFCGRDDVGAGFYRHHFDRKSECDGWADQRSV